MSVMRRILLVAACALGLQGCAMLGPMMDGMRQSGNFGGAVSVSEGASIQDKMLAMLGRQP